MRFTAALAFCLALGAQPALCADVAIVANQGAATASIVDIESMKVIATVPVGEGPHEVALAPDGRHAFITLYGTQFAAGNALSIVDLEAGTERRLDLGSLRRPHGLHAVGTKLFLTAEGAQSVARIDAVTGAVEWTGRTGRAGTHMLAVSADGATVYAVNLMADSVSVFDAGSGATAPVAEIKVGKGPEGVALSPDGRELWVSNRGGGAISIIDTASRSVVATIAPAVVAVRLRFAPDGKRVLASDLASGRLLVFDAATRTESGRIDAGALPVTVFVAPDSKRAWASALPTNELLALDLETMKVTGRVTVGAVPDGVAVRFDAASPGKRRRAVSH